MIIRTAIATAIALVYGNVFSTATESMAVGRYSFAYSINGAFRTSPVQVFDSGEKTYMQFRAGADIPAFVSAAGDTHYTPAGEGPYVVIPGAPRDFWAVMGHSRTRITHASRLTNAGHVSNTGAAVPERAAPAVQVASIGNAGVGQAMERARAAGSWEEYSYATPRRGDHVQWMAPPEESQDWPVPFAVGRAAIGPKARTEIRKLAAVIGSASRIEVIGRDDRTLKDGLAADRASAVVDELAKAGILRSKLVLKTQPEMPAQTGNEVTGVMVRAYTVRPAALLRPSQAGGSAPSDAETMAIVTALREGRLTPSDAARRLAALPRQDAAAVSARASSGAASAAALAAPSPAAPQTWEIRRTDETVQAVLTRWASGAGWRLHWNAPVTIPVTGDAALQRPDFLRAADVVITQAQRGGYAIQAKAYSNNVLVITPTETAK